MIDPGNPSAMTRMESSYRLQRAWGLNRISLRSALAEMMPGARLERADQEALLEDAARMSPEAVVGYLQALHGWNVESELPRLRVSTLVLAGALDLLVPLAASEKTSAMIPRARLAVWPQVGHSPQLERPDDFALLLIAEARRSAWRRLLASLWQLRASISSPLRDP